MKSLRILATTTMILVLNGPGCGNKMKAQDQGSLPPPPPDRVAGKIVSAVNMGDAQTDGAVIESGAPAVARPAIGGAKLHANDTLRVGERGGAMIELGGADRVAINAGTVVKIASDSAVSLEQGEIWVEDDLEGEPARLSVTSQDAKIELTGAHGAVSSDEDGVRVSLVSGSAKLEGAGGTTEVVAGQEVSLDGGGRIILKPISDAGNLVAWTENLRELIGKESTGGEPEGGIGTMAAKAPGSGNLLPFDVLSQDVTVRIQDRVAVTLIEQVFQNPTSTTVEGIYRFPIPAGARLNRFDMQIKGKLMQGEIVEKQRGRVIMKKVIDDFLYLMRDPALVEWESGSTFKTRIFPIGPKEKKRIVLSYVQMLPGEAGRYRWVLPLASGGADAPEVPAFRLDAKASGAGGAPVVHTPLYETEAVQEGKVASVGFEAQGFRAPVDFVIEVEHVERPEGRLATYGKGQKADPDESVAKVLKKAASDDAGWDWFMMDVAPAVDVQGEDLAGEADWILMVDTSRSRTAMDMQIQTNLVTAMVGALSSRDRVGVVAYDVTARPMEMEFSTPSTALLEQIEEFLGETKPAGATNLEGALRAAAALAKRSPRARIVLIGDGAATIGERRAAQLAQSAVSILSDTGAPVTTIGVGSSVDSLLMQEISRRTGGKFFDLSSGEDLLRAAVRVIATMRVPVLENVKVELSGLETRDVSPANLPNMGIGDEMSLTGRYRGQGTLRARVTGFVSGRPFEKELTFEVGEGKEANTFVPIMWAAHRIDDLTLSTDEKAAEEVIRLSKAYSLPSRWTSFIVLENDRMYQEFGVDQTDDRLDWAGDEIEYEGDEDLDDPALDFEGNAQAPLGGIGKGGGAAMGPPPAKAKKSAKPAMSAAKSSAPMAESKPRPKDDSGGGVDDFLDNLGYVGSGYKHPKGGCTATTSVTVTQLPPETGDAKVAKTLEDLTKKVEENPLHRLHRKRLVNYLIRLGRLDEAAAQVADWESKDSADPTVLEYAGDMARLSGDLTGALRIYSGAVDMDPERKKTLEAMALWMESREQWDLAYAFRTALHLVKPTDQGAILRMAVAASRAGYADSAREAALLLAEQTASGELKLKKGVKLSSSSRDAVLRLAAGDKLPLGYGAADPGSAKLKVELTWSSDADLDLWVITSSGKLMGGDKKDGQLLGSTKGTVGETFFMPKGDPGRFSVQVHCGSGTCGNVAGKLKIKAHGEKKTIPFVMTEGKGLNLAEFKIVRNRHKCAIW